MALINDYDYYRAITAEELYHLDEIVFFINSKLKKIKKRSGEEVARYYKELLINRVLELTEYIDAE